MYRESILPVNAATGLEGGTLSREDFITHWGSIEKVLDSEPEMWADYFTKESIYSDVMNGNIQVWAFSKEGKIRVVLFTRLVEYPAVRVLHIMMGFGNELKQFLPQIEATLEHFARVMKCGMCEIIGREGWEKILSHRFKKHGVVLRSEIRQDKVN